MSCLILYDPNLSSGIRYFQLLKINAIDRIHQIILRHSKSLIQAPGTLSLLAGLSFYPKQLFTRTSEYDSRDSVPFEAITGSSLSRERPLWEHGHLLFSTLLVSPGSCPTVSDEGKMSRAALEIYFRLDMFQINNLVCGRGKNARKMANQVTNYSPPSADVLLYGITNPSLPLSQILESRGCSSPFKEEDTHLFFGQSADEIVETIFIIFCRAVWERIPSEKQQGGKLLSWLKDPEMKKRVQEEFSVENFRSPNNHITVGTLLRRVEWIREKGNIWDSTFTKYFGLIEEGNWKKPTQNQLGFHPYLEHLMTSIMAHERSWVYDLLQNKYNTLVFFPQFHNARIWSTSTKPKQGGKSGLRMLTNPHIIEYQSAGYQ